MGRRNKKSVITAVVAFRMFGMSKLERSPSLQEILEWSTTLDDRAKNFTHQAEALAERLRELEQQIADL